MIFSRLRERHRGESECQPRLRPVDGHLAYGSGILNQKIRIFNGTNAICCHFAWINCYNTSPVGYRQKSTFIITSLSPRNARLTIRQQSAQCSRLWVLTISLHCTYVFVERTMLIAFKIWLVRLVSKVGHHASYADVSHEHYITKPLAIFNY